MNRNCDSRTCRRPGDDVACSICWVETKLVFEDISIAYRAFLEVVYGAALAPGADLRYRYKEGLWTVTYDHGPSLEQIFACGKTPRAALDALVVKSRLKETQ